MATEEDMYQTRRRFIRLMRLRGNVPITPKDAAAELGISTECLTGRCLDMMRIAPGDQEPRIRRIASGNRVLFQLSPWMWDIIGGNHGSERGESSQDRSE